MKTHVRLLLAAMLLFGAFTAPAQTAAIAGKVTSAGGPVAFASVGLSGTTMGATSDAAGFYRISQVPAGTYTVKVSAVGYAPASQPVTVAEGQAATADLQLAPAVTRVSEVVITGTMKEVSRLESPVPVEVYTKDFFKKNPTPSLFEALQNVNGVRPQLNCNVCNTGDIHINGLEGPYTMILIDGMPIVSGLSSVYGLSGIPNAMVERIEIVKGPASSLYGSEAVGGLINVITKKPSSAPLFYADVFATSWQEYNADLAFKLNAGRKASVLTGVNYFNYSNPIDNNGDRFTDVTLQDRISVFQKWNFQRKENRLLSLAGRYYYEDRWGGDTRWNKSFRGGDSIYGESIYTDRRELIGNYQLPVKEKMLLMFSVNDHRQNSYYGDIPYFADQKIAFSQLTWDKKINNHDLLLGTALRYTYYDDNTPATAGPDTLNPGNQPDRTWLPGIFVQDEIALSQQHKLLLGMRYDYNSRHGDILTPRVAYKWSINDSNILRLNAGTGFRVVNLFTEEHAALTGSRIVDVQEALDPEKSYNINVNYIKKVVSGSGAFVGFDASAWYTYFNNRIIPDYDTDPNRIIYGNLRGHAVTQGVTLNMDVEFLNGLKILAGGTYMDVYTKEEDEGGSLVKQRQVLTEKWTGTWAVTYKVRQLNLGIDYTGNLYGPMRLPLLGDLDPRPEYSPWWSIQNIQLTWGSPGGRLEIYGGVKNLLNFTPAANSIARSNDPFDREVQFDGDGQAVPTPNNPYALTFDPAYVYAPNQGIRGFLGVRVSIR